MVRGTSLRGRGGLEVGAELLAIGEGGRVEWDDMVKSEDFRQQGMAEAGFVVL